MAHPGLIPPKKGEIRNPWGPRGKDGTKGVRRYFDVMETLEKAGFDPVKALMKIAAGEDSRLAYCATRDLFEKSVKSTQHIEHAIDPDLQETLDLKEKLKEALDDQKQTY